MPLVVHDGPGSTVTTFDHLHDSDTIHDSSPLELSDAGSGPRTPPALLNGAQLPADPKHAIWPYPRHQQPTLAKKVKKPSLHSHTPTPAKGAPPTISTFSANNLNHIHIVQPYVHANNTSFNNSSHTTNSSANPCTTSTFSVHPSPAPASGQFSFANPYCTNALHTFMPTMGGNSGASSTGAAGQPPRPANAWILYRSDKMKDIAPPEPGQPRPPQADISKLIAAMWKNEQPEVRQHYEALSDMKKAEHLALYPGYRFQPMKKADREKVRAEKRAEKEREKMAAMAAKNARKPKARRGATEESVDMQSPTVHQAMAALPWQVQVPPTPTTMISSPTTASRGHAFSYQPYALPSPSSSTPAAPMKRKRAKTKVEAQTPAIPPEEPQHEYMHAPQEQYYDPNGMDYSSYHHGAQYDTPQLSTAATTDPNSLHTPPFDTVDPNLASQQQHISTPSEALSAAQYNAPAISATLEPISGQHDIFQFTNFDPSNLGSEITLELPQDFDWGLGLGLEGNMAGFEGFSGFESFGDLANLEGFDPANPGPGLLDGVEGLEGLGMGMNIDPNALSFSGEGMYQSFDQTQDQGQGHPQGLTISTQALHSHSHSHSISESVTSPVVETPISAGGQFGSFQIQPQVYGQYPSHSHSHSQQFVGQGFQGMLSPTQEHFASPPPMSVVDEGSVGVATPVTEGYAPPGGAAMSGRGARRVAGKWR